MTGDAGKHPDFVNDPGWFRLMALIALELRMTLSQRKLGCIMFHRIKGSWLEALNAVTSITCSALQTRGELAAVGILFMAIGTLSKCHGYVEFPVGMACIAS